jgi:hypothetical protein
MADCRHPYTPAATNYPEEGRSGDPKRHPWDARSKYFLFLGR